MTYVPEVKQNGNPREVTELQRRGKEKAEEGRMAEEADETEDKNYRRNGMKER